MKQLDKLFSVKPICLPEIREYGIASKSSSLYLVTDRVQGVTWGNISAPVADKLNIIDRLIAAVEYLHDLGFSHGDIHPANVMMDENSKNIFLIDMPDFIRTGEESKNHAYSPDNIDNCSPDYP
ncbi:serine/threonine-protein kinase [Aeromonas caviae]|uniref:serine/threonine-protein kinase n=1 Tax=Aeromonas caviae TaxID=648 RepID=UPI002B24F4D6|nr:serine/threonine-protein kinase [Aeromonas caviae]MEA9434212.1 serine/threonine-protein kinase [Aeromonas caviae]